MKPPTVAESGVGSAGECGLTEGTEVTGATSEVAGDDARFGVQQKVLREERAFPGVGHFRLQGVRISAHPLKEESEASERGRRIALFCELALLVLISCSWYPTMPSTRSTSSSPSRASSAPAKQSTKQTNKTTKQTDKSKQSTAARSPPPQDDSEDSSAERDDADASSASSAGFMDQELESVEERHLDIERRQRELDAERADNRAKAVQLLTYPTGPVPRSLPTSASSSVSSGPSSAARAAAVVASAADQRRRQDTITVAAARAARLDRVRSMVGISHGASRPPLVRDELDDRHARDVGAKRVRFAVDPDAEDDDVVALAAPEDVSRKQWLNQTRRLLLFLARSTLAPTSALLPCTLTAAQTFVYSSALSDIRQGLHVSLGNQPATFANFLYVLNTIKQYLPPLFPGRPDRSGMAIAAVSDWHAQFSDELNQLMRLANDNQQFVDAQMPIFVLKLRSVDPDSFDPVVIIKAMFADVTVSLVAQRQKEAMKLALSSDQPQQYQMGGKGFGGRGSGKGGKGKGGKGGSHPQPPGMPGQEWSDNYWMYIRFACDSAGRRVKGACFKCGCPPNSPNPHRANLCQATPAQIDDWVRYMKPAQ